jgi:cephalosporin hydroxylase
MREAKTPGVQPMTVVENAQRVSSAEMAERILRTRHDHAEILQRFHEVWYTAPHTWQYTHFLGVGLMKCPNDLWMYQALLSEYRPRTIIETGTYTGGSALWFAFLMEMLHIDGHVYTVDFEDHRTCDHPRITFLGGDCTNPALVEQIAARAQRPLLISLDSDHAADHVRRELELYAPLTEPGEWLIVEDTNIGWKQPDGTGDRGARGGIDDYLAVHPGEFRQDIVCERYLLTMNPGGWMQRMAPCPHG